MKSKTTLGFSPGRSIAGARGSKEYRFTSTKYGVIFLVVLSGMLWGSTNYHSNLGLVMTFLLGSMAIVSTVHTFRNFRGIEIEPNRADNVFAGEDAAIEVVVRAGPWPRRAVRLQFANGEPRTFDLAAGEESRLSLIVHTTARGALDPGILYLWTEYPYGLFRCWTGKRAPVAAWVYPRPTAGPFSADAIDAGRRGRTAASQGMDDFKGLRPYRPGDPPQHIAWKASARGEDLLTKELEGSGGGQVLMFDWDRIEPGNVEYKLSRLCHQVMTAHRGNLKFGLTLPGVTISPSTGEEHRRRCLETLARYEG